MNLESQYRDRRIASPAPSRHLMPRAGVRAGQRSLARSTEPTGVFVVVEMTVLVLVAALTMVTIIVSGDHIGDEARSARATPRSALPAAPVGTVGGPAGPSSIRRAVGTRIDAVVGVR